MNDTMAGRPKPSAQVRAAQARAEPFERAAETLLRESGCTVLRWRSDTTGLAHLQTADWYIEVPAPRGPVSFGVFAHEVGHQLLHRQAHKPRWLEEWEAWHFALAQFHRFELPGVGQARRRAAGSLRYAAKKAVRRHCSPETAQQILDTFPLWVWDADDPRERAAADVVAALEARSR